MALTKKFSSIFLSIMIVLAFVPSTASADTATSSANVLEAAPLISTYSSTSTNTASSSDENASSGFSLEKSLVTNEDGSQSIILEAYVDDLSNLDTSSTPCDIVLVLDQSGSMASDFGTEESYHEESGLTNAELELLAQNDSLYTVLDDGTYTPVTVTIYRSKYYVYTWAELSGSYHYSLYADTIPSFDGVTFYSHEAETMSHLDALKIAATSFIESIKEDSYGADGIADTSDDVDHRIAIVGFAYNDQYSYGNTELFIGSNSYVYNDSTSSAQSQYSSALQDITSDKGYNNVFASIGQLDAEGGTYINYGLGMANGIFEENPLDEGENRNRVTLVLTDGSPGMYGGDFDIANSAIEQSSILKSDSIGSTVYSIGIFSGADASSGLLEVDNTWDSQESNLFMHLLSNDYPDSISMTETGSRYTTEDGSTPSYYLSAADSESLTTIFESISNEVGGIEVSPGEEYFLRDILADNYSLPDGVTAEDITVSTQSYLGEDAGWAEAENLESAVVAIDGGTVDVTGFDFAGEWVGENDSGAFGSKIIVEIPVECTATFGGTSYTNEADSGIYASTDGTLLDIFESPVDSSEISYDLSTTNDLIYLGETANISSNIAWKDQYQPNGINNAFVDITYTLEANNTTYYCTIPAGTDTTSSSYAVLWTDSNRNTVSNIEVLPTESGSQTYNLTCTVSDNWDGKQAQTNLIIEKNVSVEAIPCSITLTKEISSDSYQSSDNFLIYLAQDDKTVDGYSSLLATYPDASTFISDTLEVSIQSGETLTVSGLPIGSYLITENLEWSWRYEFISAEGGTATENGTIVTLPTDESVSQANAQISIVVTNSLSTDLWLSHETNATNLFEITDGTVTVTKET